MRQGCQQMLAQQVNIGAMIGLTSSPALSGTLSQRIIISAHPEKVEGYRHKKERKAIQVDI